MASKAVLRMGVKSYMKAGKAANRSAKRAARKVKRAAKKAKRAAKKVVKKIKRAAKRVLKKKRPAKRVKKRAAIRTPEEKVKSERDILRSRAQKANRRLASLEKEDLQAISRAYRNVEGFAEKYRLDGGASIFKIDEESGTIRFRTDLAKLEKENPDLVKQLETRINNFLQAPTSTAKEVKMRRELINNDIDKYLELLEKTSPSEYEALKKSVDTINRQREDERIFRGLDRPEISLQEYVKMFYTDIWGLIEQHIKPSKERVEVARKVASGEWSEELVKEKLQSLTPGEQSNLAAIQSYITGKPTPQSKRVYTKPKTWKEKANSVGGFSWYTGKK